MKRVLNVVRLQLINKETYVWVPLIILGGSLVISLLIYALLRPMVPDAIYGGGSQAPLWYFLFVGVAAMTRSFPFSQAMSVTRRDFYLGTLLTAIGTSLVLTAIFVVGGLIEQANGGWWMNGYFFYLDWIWAAGPLVAGLFYFVCAMIFFILGFTFATIYKTWGQVALTLSWLAVTLAFVGAAFLITRMGVWGPVVMTLVNLGALGLALWGLLVVAVLAAIGFLAIRRAVP